MADPSTLRTDAVGLQRFGPGMQAGQPEAFPHDARDLILEEIRAGSVAQPADIALADTAAAGTALFSYAAEVPTNPK